MMPLVWFIWSIKLRQCMSADLGISTEQGMVAQILFEDGPFHLSPFYYCTNSSPFRLGWSTEICPNFPCRYFLYCLKIYFFQEFWAQFMEGFNSQGHLELSLENHRKPTEMLQPRVWGCYFSLFQVHSHHPFCAFSKQIKLEPLSFPPHGKLLLS